MTVSETAKRWPPLKKALWDVLMSEQLNNGHYINPFDLIEKLYAAALAAANGVLPNERPNRFCKNDACHWPDCIVTGGVCGALSDTSTNENSHG